MKSVSHVVVAMCAALLFFPLGWGVSIVFALRASDASLWGAAGTVVTAIATIVLVIVTALLWNVTDRSATSAEKAADAAADSARVAGEASNQAADTAKKQLRPYVLVEGSALTCDAGGVQMDYVQPNSLPIGTIKFKNTGQTPALKLHVNVRIGIRNEPADQDSFALEFTAPQSVTSIGAGHATASSAVAPAPISLPSVQNLAAGTEAIYLYGEIRYSDIFGDEHTTTFRLRNKGGVYNGTMTFTDQGNHAN